MSSSAHDKLHVILDIDETLVHYVSDKYIWHTWHLISESEQLKYDAINLSHGLLIKRPGLDHFLRNLMTHPRIVVHIWTWSGAEYAAEIVATLGIRAGGVVFSRRDSDASAAKYWNTKDLRYFYERVPGTSPTNTILIDDLQLNTLNYTNRHNSITVAPFAIWGRDPLRAGPYHDLSRDNVLRTLTAILRKIVKIVGRHGAQNLLSKSNVHELHLDDYMKTFRWDDMPVHALTVD